MPAGARLPPPPAHAATEPALLATLWVLEAAHDAWRSPASVCLSSYTRHLMTFSPQARALDGLHALALPWVGNRQRTHQAPASTRRQASSPPLPARSFPRLQLVARLTADWAASFDRLRQALVAAQARARASGRAPRRQLAAGH